MMWAKIEGGAIVKTGQRPKWLYDDGTPVDDARLIEDGWVPIIDQRPDVDRRRTRLTRKPQDQWEVGTEAVTVAWDITHLTDAEVVQIERQRANLPKAEFCLGLVGLGILSTDDAVSAAKGNWPDAMSGFLEYLKPEQAADVQIEWAARVSIDRMNVFVLTLASWANIPDETVDTLFGISLDDP